MAIADQRSNTTPLPHPVREHLGEHLRITYREIQERPTYLGDPALPVEFDDYVCRLALREGACERERDRGLAAVRAALGDLLNGSSRH